MFRLIKLALYGVLAYAIYELYQGMTQEEGRPTGRKPRQSDRQPSRQNITGPGRGTRTESEEASGMSASHAVGRGVVS